MGYHRYGHVITVAIARTAENAYWEGVYAAFREIGHKPDVATLKALSNKMVEYGDKVHDDLCIPREGSKN